MLVVTGFAIVVAGIGCGNGSPTSLTKAEFVRRGDKICGKARERKATAIFTYREKHLETVPARRLDDRVVTVVALVPIRRMTEELLDLTPPSRDKDQIGAIIKAFEAAAKDQEQNPDGVLEGARDPFYTANRMASKYGLHVCAEV